MKKTPSLVLENIHNLTAIWQRVNEQAGVHTAGSAFDFGVLTYSEWPNRLWFHHEPTLGSVHAAKRIAQSAPVKLVLPYWDIYTQSHCKLLESQGFECLFEQVGMVMDLKKTVSVDQDIRMKAVDTQSDARLWEALFQQAFGYSIHHSLLLLQLKGIQFFIAYQEDSPIGTVVLSHENEEVIGVHSMGIVPAMRRKGFAEQLMHKILQQSVAKGFGYATLQASSLGKGLYLKLGFEEQFTLKNYSLKLT